MSSVQNNSSRPHKCSASATCSSRCSFGFTLVEVLIVIAVIGVLASQLLPRVRIAQEKARIVRATEFLWSIHNTQGDALIGMWSLESANGGISADTSGFENHGSFENMADPSGNIVEGIMGRATEFDGVDDYIDLGDSPILKPTLEFTVVAWYNGVATERSPIYTSGFDFSDLEGVRISGFHDTDDKRARINLGDCDGSMFHVWSDDPIVENRWTHIALVYNGSLSMYIDGQIQGEPKFCAGTLTFNYDSNDEPGASIGGTLSSSNQRFDGLIDEVRVYENALQTKDVQNLYYAGVEKYDLQKKS